MHMYTWKHTHTNRSGNVPFAGVRSLQGISSKDGERGSRTGAIGVVGRWTRTSVFRSVPWSTKHSVRRCGRWIWVHMVGGLQWPKHGQRDRSTHTHTFINTLQERQQGSEKCIDSTTEIEELTGPGTSLPAESPAPLSLPAMVNAGALLGTLVL